MYMLLYAAWRLLVFWLVLVTICLFFDNCHCGTIADIKPLRFQNKVLHDWKQREKTFRKTFKNK